MRPVPAKRGMATLPVLLLLACTTGPDFQRPQPPHVQGFTAEWRMAKTVATPHQHAGRAQEFIPGMDVPAQWWRLFRSEPLNKLMDQALTANPDVQAAQAALREAQETLSATKGVAFPEVNANAGIARQKTNGAGTNFSGSLFTLYNTSVSVSYGLDPFGGTRRAVEAQEAQMETQRFQVEAVYLTLEANIITTAVQEASLKAQVAATKEIIHIQKHQLSVLKDQLKLGGIAETGVLAQKTALAQTQALLPPLQKQLAQVQDTLKALAGKFPTEQQEATFDLSTLQLPKLVPVNLPSQLVEQRPDIRAAEAQMHAASAAIGLATVDMLPKIALTGSYGYSSTHFNDLVSPGAVIWNAGAGLLQPIFHGGELTHKRRAAIAEYEAAAARYRSIVLTAFQNVADSLRAMEFDAESLRARSLATQAASDSLVLAEKQFDAGAISYLTLLDGQRAYQQTRLALVQAEAARYADTAALFVALGGGWWNNQDKSQGKEK
ncbi:MAG: efflux transporter outer membrane subunit [Proteobacteria bacterium]|nr:efflux transporter outer membrane subunit [Pseudomonadota bacterium]